MSLTNYLNGNFYCREELLDLGQISQTELEEFQRSNVMPVASYSLVQDIKCDSFFGHYAEQHFTEYYAKGYLLWLRSLISMSCLKEVYSLFCERYRNQLLELDRRGFSCNSPKFNQDLKQHLLIEWGHFLDGTYGLCTVSGLPEDIAAKELAAVIIEELTLLPERTNEQRVSLKNAVQLLDTSSAPFAPHERARSSRRRLVDNVRSVYLGG